MNERECGSFSVTVSHDENILGPERGNILLIKIYSW
jgi:hypothetical protein